MRGILLIIVLVGALPVAVVRPYIGILAWVWLGYMNPHRFVWGPAAEIPWSLLVGLATLVGVVFSSEKRRVPWNAATIVLLVFVIWMTISTFYAYNQIDAWVEWDRMIKVQLMTFVAMLVMKGRFRINALVMMIAVSVGFYGVKGGLWTLLQSGGENIVFGPPRSFFAGNNGLAVALIMTLPLVRYVQLQCTRAWQRYLLTGCLGLMAVAILATHSRGALLGLVAMGLAFWWRSPRKVLIGIIILVLAIGLVSFMPDKWTDRMSTIKTYEDDGSAMGRINAWWFAYNLALDHPFIGGGFNVFYNDALYWRYAPDPHSQHNAHSIFFEVLGEHGFVGLLLFLTLAGLVWMMGNRIRRETRDREQLRWARDLASMIQVSMVGYAVSGAFVGLAYFDLYYHLVAIMVLTNVEVDEGLAAEPAPSRSDNGPADKAPNPGTAGAGRLLGQNN